MEKRNEMRIEDCFRMTVRHLSETVTSGSPMSVHVMKALDEVISDHGHEILTADERLKAISMFGERVMTVVGTTDDLATVAGAMVDSIMEIIVEVIIPAVSRSPMVEALHH